MNTNKMPLMFLGHGSPMNAIEENEFTKEFNNLSNDISKPKAILCISAHWETKGVLVTAMERPKTIHDFRGFPKELYDVQYPAKGSPEIAQEIKDIIKNIDLDYSWGLDHGTWSVIKHLYPNADIPVLQMSLDYTKTPLEHYELAKDLQGLREKGILIVGSGNIVHNLSIMEWKRLDDIGYGFDWAIEVKEKVNNFILNDNHEPLINYEKNGKEFKLAIPTPEHYLPLLYILSLKNKDENISIFNDKAVAGSLTMTSVKIS